MTKHSFEAETGKILELLTHSIYSNKEIFLRELISNANDAIDKARITSLTNTSFLGDDNKFEIKIKIDKEKNLISIEDNGIGMTLEELHKNIGTIAKSGTKEFLDKLKKAKEGTENNLIGQFGVGFYSSFMVADKVEVETKSTSDPKGHKWISDGKSKYDIEESPRKKRGTIITLFINETNKELLEEYKIKELIKKYSNYVGTPIMLEIEKKDDKGNITGKEFEQVNETKPLWKKSKTEIKKEEYDEFYKSISMDFNKPLSHIHLNTEGVISYKSILFIPEQKNMFNDMRDPNKDYGPKLYVQNVLILEHAKELLPVWLRFISGVVETSDLPLNISREMLQSNTVLDKIKKSLTKKVIGEIKKTIKSNNSGYKKFLENYSQVLKEGIYYDFELKEEIAGVIEFTTLFKSDGVLLDDYLESLKTKKTVSDDKEKKEEKFIYYITAKSKQEALASPYLEQFRKNNVDVVILSDPIDEWIVQSLTEYKGAKLKSITSSDIKLMEETEEEKTKKDEEKKDYKDILELIKNTIGSDKIEKVELNYNLGNALGALKTPEGGLNPHMEKMMKSMGQQVPAQKRILELNPNSDLVKSMKEEFKKDIKSNRLKDMINYSYNQAIMLEGGEIEDIGEFVGLMNKIASSYLK